MYEEQDGIITGRTGTRLQYANGRQRNAGTHTRPQASRASGQSLVGGGRRPVSRLYQALLSIGPA